MFKQLSFRREKAEDGAAADVKKEGYLVKRAMRSGESPQLALARRECTTHTRRSLKVIPNETLRPQLEAPLLRPKEQCVALLRSAPESPC